MARLRPGRLGLAAIALAAALPVAMPPALRAALLAPALGALPGLLLAPRLLPGGSRAQRAALALVLSPFLVAAPAALMVLAGCPVGVASRVTLVALAALALWDATRDLPPVARDGAGAAFGPALAWTALVAALLIGDRALPPRSDGWFHAAVTLQIAARGLRVEDPAFAGLPLLYFWGYHLWAALWLALDPRLAPWTPLIALNLAAACATLLGVAALARRLSASAGASGLAAALAALGYAPFAWGMVAARALTGEVRGLAELRRLMTLGADPALRALSAGTLHASLAFFGDKFLVLTPFALGLALFAVSVLAFLDLVERPSPRSVAALASLEAAALFFHTVVGLTFALLAAAWWLVVWLGRRGPAHVDSRRALLPLFLALAVAGLALVPYLMAVAGPKHAQFGGGFSPRAIGSWLFAGALFVPPGMAWLVARARQAGPARELLVFALALTALALSLKLSQNNQSKFFNLLFLLLAAPAALQWIELRRRLRGGARWALVALLALAALPNAALCVWAFACERGQNEEPAHAPGAATRAAWDWARAHLPADAVLVDAAGGSDMLVFAARSALWGGGTVERDWGHAAEALELRRRASRQLACAGPLAPEARALLAGLGRELVVVARAREAADSTSGWHRLARAPDRYHLLYRNDAIALYRWMPKP